MTDGAEELLSKIDMAMERVRTREDLVAFVDLLIEGVEAKVF